MPLTASASRNRWFVACVLLVIGASVLFFYDLGTGALQDYDEAIYAQVIHDTLASDNVITLHKGALPWFEKPPLYFWISMFMGTFIQDPELAYRVGSALAGIASVILVMLILHSLTSNYRTACMGGLIMLTSPAFFEAARQVRLDVPVTAAILLALYAFIRGKERPVWYLLMGASVAVAVLFKGAIGFLAIPILLIWAITMQDFSWLRQVYFWAGVGVSLIVALPWHVYETLLYGGAFWKQYLGVHVLDRFEGNILGGQSAASNMTYVIQLATIAQPWTLAFAASLVFTAIRRTLSSHLRIALAFGLQALFILGCFLLAGTKLAYYLTPTYPFMALCIAIVCGAVLEMLTSVRARQFFMGMILAVLVLALANTIYVGFHFHPALRVNAVLSAEEKDIGLTVAQTEPIPLYAYQYPYLDTVQYYSGRPISMMQDDQILDHSFHLIMRNSLYASNPFPPELASHFTPVYQGRAVVLLRFDL